MIKKSHVITLIAIAGSDVVLGMATYASLPNSVPAHWNISGAVDRYGAPWELAFVLPCFVAIAAGLLILLAVIKPFASSIARFQVTYGRTSIAMVGTLVLVHAILLLNALGWTMQVEKVVPGVVGMLVLILGNWMGKLRRNGLIGIRTPWTLANDAVWERTHRIGGPLLMLYGLAILCTAWIATSLTTFVVLIGGALALAVWAFAYSWRISDRVRHTDDGLSLGGCDRKSVR
jgi:uncharacterized membrane protein